MKKNKPEYAVVYTVFDDGNRGMGDMSRDYTMLVNREELNKMVAKRGTSWIKTVYKLGDEMVFLEAKLVNAFSNKK